MKKLTGMWAKVLRIIIYTSIIFLISSFFSVDGAYDRPVEKGPDTVLLRPPYLLEQSRWIDSILASLTGEEKIAQLMMVAVYPEQGEKHFNEIEKLIENRGIGGLIFFRGEPFQQVQLTNRFQQVAKVPLLISMDGEWGLAMRLNNTIRYPRQMMLGAIQDNRLIYKMGEDIGEQCARMGMQINFAPVVDINYNPLNPVIGSRSFGEDRGAVAAKGMAYMLGMQGRRVVATAKHFPGHGDTDTDSHRALPVINHSKQRLDSIELYPFKEMINMGLGAVMVAHLFIPSIDTTPDQATTLSKACVTGLLKDSLGFEGLVVTDALNMGGVSDYFKPEEIAAKALVAGNDILLMPSDVHASVQAIKKEIEQGTITWEEINKRCKKIVQLKYWAHLDKQSEIDTSGLMEDLHRPEYEVLRRQLIASSLTLLVNLDNIVPFKRLDTLKIASVAIGSGGPNEFQKTLGLYTDIKNYTISKDADENEFLRLNDELKSFNVVIVSVHHTNMHVQNRFGITNRTINFVDSLCESQKVVLDLFASPYSLAYFSKINKAQVVLLSYEDDEIIQGLSAQLLFGGITARGRLPVSVSDNFKLGQGIDTQTKNRLAYGIPEEVGIRSSDLLEIDSLVYDALSQRATPGCQVLAAKDGVVFYHKSFGYHTYLQDRSVQNTDIYDIASITKIAATVPAIMRLYEQGKIDIDEKLSRYLSYLDTTNKKDITIQDILAHNASLAAWIPFYALTLEGFYLDEKAFSENYSDTFPIRLNKDLYMNRHIKYKEGYYSYMYTEDYPIQITEKLFLNRSFRDTIFRKIAISGLRTKNGYKYSDIGFYLLHQMIEDITDTLLSPYVFSHFYNPLGANTLGYLPLERFSLDRIPPTEDDIVFRKQLVHGYVHDPGAAMLGGVCGHAGLFSNANDLAKLMQMYLQGGEYGGIKYFDKETIDLFTSCPYCDDKNRRGLGFDKPQMEEDIIGPTCNGISEKSFGHTGYTGTYAWADPETQTVYIFLSNRCHPDAENNKLLDMNVRTNIQRVIIEAAKGQR